jgi:hypothetical protein
VAVHDHGDHVALLHAAIDQRLDRLAVARVRAVEVLRREALQCPARFAQAIGE